MSEATNLISILAISSSLIVVITTTLAYYVINKQLNDLHLSLNSRLTELLTSTKALARAEGFTAGKEQRNNDDVGG